MKTADNAHTFSSAVVQLRTIVPASADKSRLSPNSNERPPSVTGIGCIVLHATADQGNQEGAESWLCSADSRVSAHLHIRRDGTVVRLVGDHLRAWHAGPSEWQGRADVNDFSLGWEIANRNDGRELYTTAQYAALARLGAHYVEQGLPLNAFVSHAEVALPRGRKTDPEGFDWMGFKIEVLRRIAGD
jgi:N-acetylmuramoyl-L-alanine amidase